MGRYILLGIVVFAASAAVVDFLSDRGMHGGQSAHLGSIPVRGRIVR